MNKFFDGELLNGYEDSPITYVYGGNLEECHKVIADLEAKLAENDKTIANLRTDLKDWEDLEEKISTKYDKVVEQLAEKDETIKGLIGQYKNMEQSCSYQMFEDFQKQIEQLKQQLAEKDIRIRALQEQNLLFKSDINMAVKIQNKHNQDKISFCIEQLVNIQKYITDNVVFVEEECFGREINEFIDNQIEELKKEMK